MAKVQYSGLVTQIKGKMRGAIFQSGSAGQVIRSAKNFNRSASERWQIQKNRTSVVAKAWNTLSAAERLAWEASAVNTPATNNFGEPRIPSGYNMFTKTNMTVLATGGTLMTAPSMAVQLSSVIGATGLVSDPTYIAFDSHTIITADELMLVDCSAPILPSRKVPPTGFKRVGNFYNPFSPSYDITSYYYAIFGKPPVNSKIVTHLYVYNAITGQKGPMYLININIGV